MSEDYTPANTVSPHRIHKSNGSISGPAFTDVAPPLNLRSCMICRRRKVKCDKRTPCSNCARARTECVFPGPGRAPRKSRNPPDTELLDRLRRLEGVVSTLSAQVEEHEQEAADRDKGRPQSVSGEGCPHGGNTASSSVAVNHSVEGLEILFGKLVVKKGRSRYINNSLWVSLNNEVEDLKSILIEPSDDEDAAQSPDATGTPQYQGFVFGHSPTSVDLHELHPSENQACQFWNVYKENIDPLVKVLHIPTFEPKFYQAVSNLDKVPKGIESLLFVIYYGAVTSTTPEDCLARWGEDRTTMLNRFQIGVEQGLAHANFLCCQEIVVLQAFVIFLILLRRNDDPRKIWTLAGLAVRISQTLGIHRDGSHFNLQPFEIEMRRRLWWQVCILDARSSEDHGCNPTVVETFFDTKMPLNVNDDDLKPDMTEFPEERQRFTDMTFCLVLFEITNIFRQILYIQTGPNRCTKYFAGLTMAEKEKWITEVHHAMEEKYLRNCDISIPLCWVTATVSRLIMSKMWLVVYHPHQRKDGGATLPQHTKDKLFITSLENIEYSILLETEAKTMKWGWLFRTYVQWYAIAFLLSELCVRTKGEAVDRAWRVLEASAGRWQFPLNDDTPHRKCQQDCLWKPLRKLLAKAKAAREKEIALERESLGIGGGHIAHCTQSLNQIRIPSGRADQSDTVKLDGMLRPLAPRLRERSDLHHFSRIRTPIMAEASLPILVDVFPDRAAESPGRPQQQMHVPNGSQSINDDDFKQRLMSTFGFDSVLADVMQDIDYSTINTPTILSSTTQSGQFPIVSSQSQNFLTDTDTNSVIEPVTGVSHGTLGDGVFTNPGMDLSTPIPARTPVLNGMEQQQISPTLDSGNMDWTLWDDLVTQYGFEEQAVNPATTNGPGHLGMLHWF